MKSDLTINAIAINLVIGTSLADFHTILPSSLEILGSFSLAETLAFEYKRFKRNSDVQQILIALSLFFQLSIFSRVLNALLWFLFRRFSIPQRNKYWKLYEISVFAAYWGCKSLKFWIHQKINNAKYKCEGQSKHSFYFLKDIILIYFNSISLSLCVSTALHIKNILITK